MERIGVGGDALIYTAHGLRPARDVRSTDVVFLFDEATRTLTPSPVQDVVGLGVAELFDVRVGTRTVRVTEHVRLLSLVDKRRPGRRRRRFRAEWLPLWQLEPGSIVGIARKTPDLGTVRSFAPPATTRDGRALGITLPSAATEDLMWWLGLYAGDGCVHHLDRSGRKRRIEFAIPSSQPDVRIELESVARALFRVEAWPRDDWAMIVPGIRIVDFVEAIGLGGKALEKRIPDWVFASPEAHRLAFLGGYVDADGDIRAAHKNKDMGLTSGNRLLLEDARRLALSCGIRASVVFDFRSKDPLGSGRLITGYRMRFAGNFDRVSCRSERRRTRMRKRKFFHSDTAIGGTTIRSHTSEWLGFARIDRIERVDPEDVFELGCEKRRPIVVEGLIVG